jgi:hypothetical protein
MVVALLGLLLVLLHPFLVTLNLALFLVSLPALLVLVDLVRVAVCVEPLHKVARLVPIRV